MRQRLGLGKGGDDMAKPEDKPMKMQWVEIDGRSTPIVLPQIWDHDKEDWIVTSTDNPLPTQVTGSIVEKINEVEGISDGTSRSVYWGASFHHGGGGNVILDVSKYKEILVVVENLGDVSTSDASELRFFTSKSGPAEGINSPKIYKTIELPFIEAGATLVATSEDYSELKGFLIGVVYRSWARREDVHLKVTFWGRKY